MHDYDHWLWIVNPLLSPCSSVSSAISSIHLLYRQSICSPTAADSNQLNSPALSQLIHWRDREKKTVSSFFNLTFFFISFILFCVVSIQVSFINIFFQPFHNQPEKFKFNFFSFKFYSQFVQGHSRKYFSKQFVFILSVPDQNGRGAIECVQRSQQTKLRMKTQRTRNRSNSTMNDKPQVKKKNKC